MATRSLRRLSSAACAVTLATSLGACATASEGPSRADPTGPPRVRTETVERHTAQFDDELADRPAGSQQELAASQYLLGHLQRAGYVVALEAVPVENLVESNNLEALPPNGSDPDTIVVCPYDADATDPNGTAVGVFLEVARALYAAQPDHSVEFAALAAETTRDRLGSRRLAQQLRDEGASPRIISIVPGRAEALLAAGGDATAIVDSARESGIDAKTVEATTLLGGEDVFAEAGFDHVVIAVADARQGSAILDYLVSARD